MFPRIASLQSERMNQRMQRSLVSMLALMLCMGGAIDFDVFQQDPTWIEGIYDSADYEDDGDDVGMRAADTPATRNGQRVGDYSPAFIPLQSFTASRSVRYERPYAVPEVRGPPEVTAHCATSGRALPLVSSLSFLVRVLPNSRFLLRCSVSNSARRPIIL